MCFDNGVESEKSLAQLKEKWRALLDKYKSVCDNNNRTGREKKPSKDQRRMTREFLKLSSNLRQMRSDNTKNLLCLFWENSETYLLPKNRFQLSAFIPKKIRTVYMIVANYKNKFYLILNSILDTEIHNAVKWLQPLFLKYNRRYSCLANKIVLFPVIIPCKFLHHF